MSGNPVELRVGGQTYRVVASADEDELHRLAKLVDGKLREISAGGSVQPQTLLLAALTLAHELEQERAKRREVEQRAKDMLTHALARIDAALEAGEVREETQPSQPPADR